MWWIKWGDLYYITKEGNIGMIFSDDYDIESKWPEDIEMD